MSWACESTRRLVGVMQPFYSSDPLIFIYWASLGCRCHCLLQAARCACRTSYRPMLCFVSLAPEDSATAHASVHTRLAGASASAAHFASVCLSVREQALAFCRGGGAR